MKTNDGKTPFDFAAKYGHLDVLKEYFQHESSSRQTNLSVDAFIQSAIRHYNSVFISEHISSITYKDKRHMLELACRHIHGDEILADPNIWKYFDRTIFSQGNPIDGFTLLMIAVKYRREKCVEALLTNSWMNASILEKTSHDFERTVLHICAEYPNESITDALLTKVKLYRLDLAPADIMGNTPLHICAEKNNIFMCRQLLSDSNPNFMNNLLTKKNNNGFTAFHLAVENEHIEMITTMLNSVAPKYGSVIIESGDQQLRTSLHIAALQGMNFI